MRPGHSQWSVASWTTFRGSLIRRTSRWTLKPQNRKHFEARPSYFKSIIPSSPSAPIIEVNTSGNSPVLFSRLPPTTSCFCGATQRSVGKAFVTQSPITDSNLLNASAANARARRLPNGRQACYKFPDAIALGSLISLMASAAGECRLPKPIHCSYRGPSSVNHKGLSSHVARRIGGQQQQRPLRRRVRWWIDKLRVLIKLGPRCNERIHSGDVDDTAGSPLLHLHSQFLGRQRRPVHASSKISHP